MRQRPSVILYHYTGADGLLGITSSDSLWATNIRFMNDSSEFKHATDIAASHLRGLRAGRNGDSFAQLAAAVTNHIESISNLSLYVACFSEDYDSLSQWRGYCPRSLGYNVGFDGDRLRAIAGEQGFQLHPCIYERAKQQAAVREWAISTVEQLHTSLPHGADPAEHAQLNCNAFLQKFISFAPYMKDSSFGGEREWRLVALISSSDQRVELRVGRSTLVPYVPVKLRSQTDESPLWDIRVGPTPNVQLAMDAAVHLFRKVKLRNGIGQTSIPYRDW